MQHANDVMQRRAGGLAERLDVVDDVLGLDLRPRAEPGLPRIVHRGNQAVAVIAICADMNKKSPACTACGW